MGFRGTEMRYRGDIRKKTDCQTDASYFDTIFRRKYFITLYLMNLLKIFNVSGKFYKLQRSYIFHFNN